MITADHGCDPATPSTDHSREYTPLLLCGDSVQSGVNLTTRSSFADIAATIWEALLPEDDRHPLSFGEGKSFWQEVARPYLDKR